MPDPPSSAPATIANRDPARLRADEALTVSSDFEQRYQLGAELARGGLARIRDAWDRVLHRQVAVKQLLERSADSDVRFLREARITGRLAHPSIVPIYDLGLDADGAPFYVMKWVLGRSLHELIEDRPTLDDRLALLPHAIAITDALAYAHNAGVVHRDLKPANVQIGDYGETIVIDWGLAVDLDAPELDAMPTSDGQDSADGRLTSVGSVIGTPAYMPPEQARGERVDARADVFALGAVLYQVIAGSHPYADETDGLASTDDPVWVRVIDRGPRPLALLAPDAPPELVAIVERAMARDAADRYPTATALGAALAGFVTHHQSHRLAAAALRRDDELALRLRAVAPDDAAAVAQIYREADVVRFGFDQALAAWADNPIARAGLIGFCARLFDFECAVGNLAGAAALASELPPDPERTHRLAALHEQRARRAAEAAAFAHAHDRSIGGRERLIVLVVLGAMLGYYLIEAFTAHRDITDVGAGRRIFYNSLVVSGPVVGLIWLWRRRLFANDFSRRAATGLLVLMVTTVSHRAMAMVLEHPAGHTFTLDLLLIAVALIGFGGRAALALGVGAMIMAWICTLVPAAAVFVYNATIVGYAGLLAWSWTRVTPRRP